MRIAVFTRVFPPSVGGVETLVATLARGLALDSQARLELSVITSTPAEGMKDSELPFQVIREPGVRQLFQTFRAADVVHLAGPSLLPLALALLLRKRVVLSHHGFQTVCPNGQLFFEPTQTPCPGHFMAARHKKCWECNRARGWRQSVWIWFSTFLRRWLAARASANVVPTHWLGSLLGLPRTKVILHGVPETRAADGEGWRDAISFLGRLVSTKGVHVLLDAAKELRNRGLRANLRIVGDGPERATLEKRAQELGLNGCVKFCGSVADAELSAVLGKSIAVVPSLGGEVFGLVAAQSMMAGRPVVASDLGSLAEVVGDAGLIFPAGSAQGLADSLEKLLRAPEWAVQIGQRARQRATDLFRTERMTREHAELYASLLPQKQNDAPAGKL